ncbi:MAG: sulfurtransferase complex subunit TusB [Halieaceae bacterium]
MLLHTLNSTPQSSATRDCCSLIGNQDAVILFGDGVYCALVGSNSSDALTASGAVIYALAADVDAAGIATRLSDQVSIIDYAEFVAISEKYPRQMAWY